MAVLALLDSSLLCFSRVLAAVKCELLLEMNKVSIYLVYIKASLINRMLKDSNLAKVC